MKHLWPQPFLRNFRSHEKASQYVLSARQGLTRPCRTKFQASNVQAHPPRVLVLIKNFSTPLETDPLWLNMLKSIDLSPLNVDLKQIPTTSPSPEVIKNLLNESLEKAPAVLGLGEASWPWLAACRHFKKERSKVLYLPLWHPSELTQNVIKKREVWQQLQRLALHLKSLDPNDNKAT